MVGVLVFVFTHWMDASVAHENMWGAYSEAFPMWVCVWTHWVRSGDGVGIWDVKHRGKVWREITRAASLAQVFWTLRSGNEGAAAWRVRVSTQFQFMWGSPHHLEILSVSWASYNSTQLWHYLPRDSIRSHRLRILCHEPALSLPLPIVGSGCYLCLWLTGYKPTASTTPSWGSINVQEQLTGLRKPAYSLDYQFSLFQNVLQDSN